jgi:hypothetical protein
MDIECRGEVLHSSNEGKEVEHRYAPAWRAWYAGLQVLHTYLFSRLLLPATGLCHFQSQRFWTLSAVVSGHFEHHVTENRSLRSLLS